ncbi:hypothetical protein M501DRAFT_1028100 [Patellaria atrata CBS 101060]|uniref:C2H2-type domain-containing protein n=1 Tax=Patellaria atrata CBS 101060 TaxID=1346257 RepID=A0A9P4SHY7_9PEZI|nr:hypothetical protein M501DRAFT_1028100 [Patellaria atrata CBS 101060]
MPPRSFTNPAPKTESAREARKTFFCDLCNKGYSRMNEFESHEQSYDHQHRKRLKDMKQMQRDPNAADKARRAERRADEASGLIAMKIEDDKPITTGKFKKAGFVSAFRDEEVKPGFKKAFAEDEIKPTPQPKEDEEDESDFETSDPNYYNPTKPTGCATHSCTAVY